MMRVVLPEIQVLCNIKGVDDVSVEVRHTGCNKSAISWSY